MSVSHGSLKGPVLVTGATGYVAGWIVKELLEAGVTVHAAVRNASNKDKIRHLDELNEKYSGELKYFEADLLKNGSFAEAMKGCTVVFHTASPFTSNFTDPQKDLVDPAKKGTENVLETANQTETVTRIVLTSSVVAMYGDNQDLTKLPNQTLDESAWNTTSTLETNPYAYSKTVAEKLAWEIFEKQNQWDLVVINPGLVMGPGLGSAGTSESYEIMKSFGNGLMKSGVPKVGLGVVDVRDVAVAHVNAAAIPSAKGRYLISGHNTSLLGIGKLLAPEYQAYPLPTRELPKFMVWLVGPMVDKMLTRRYVCANVNYEFKADHSKSVQELGVKYRPLKTTVCEFFQQLIDNKVLPAK
jgi:dihydroflavonol-4-reductase